MTRGLPNGFTLERLTDFVNAWNSSRYELLAPDGFHFLGGEHARLCDTVQEARAFAREPLAACPPDCDCMVSA